MHNIFFFIVAHKLHIPVPPARAEREALSVTHLRLLFWTAHRYARTFSDCASMRVLFWTAHCLGLLERARL